LFPTPIDKTSVTTQRLYAILLPLLLLVWLLPVFAVVSTAMRSQGELSAGNYWGWPQQFSLIQNYIEVFTRTSMVQYFFNSMRITIPSVLAALFIGSLAAYGLAAFRMRMSNFILYAFIAGNFVPFQILMIPVRDFSIATGLYDTVTGLVLFHVGFQTAFCALFLCNFIKTLPTEYFDAARSEGVGEFRIFVHIVLPLITPALVTLASLLFTFIWNDYFWATVLVMGEHSMPITAGVKSLTSVLNNRWNLISAASILAAIPPVILFFFLQQYFLRGLNFNGD